MSTKHMTLLLWYGETAGVKVNRRYDIDSNDKFKDFFGARRTIEEGVWKQTDEKVLVGSKAFDRMSVEARELVRHADNVILPAYAKWSGVSTKVRNNLKRGAFALNYHNEARIDIESMDFQPIEERVAAMMATGHAGTLTGRWSASSAVNQVNKSKGNCSTCTAGICTQRCVK